ncbi:hypothetical protein QFZ37_002544 [Chryseobacterium ginsenosidimutans]|uniref:hypothetical protein n=1 Tax=Chryseobacterium ginsenosidimutans TaxID=687846 RepID=UPI00278AAF86|nr:hypothetical protein [Chryseobacterium ginsenosidimutans]MDQ0594175.1 hypothetical protein [Chryseobacterium ginsenosidimutans]
METKEYLSKLVDLKNGSTKTSKGIKSATKVFALGILALFAFGVFTTSQRLNAG